jgi:RluA family pseudouridine synthase
MIERHASRFSSDAPADPSSHPCSSSLRPRFLGSPDAGLSFEFEAACPARARDVLLAVGISRPTTAKLLEQGRVKRNGQQLSQAVRVEAGDVLAIYPMPPACSGDAADVAQGEHPAVAYEDEFIIAVDKPQGLLIHGDGTGADLLSRRVQAMFDARVASDGAIPRRVQALQRLDMDTSGIVLFSKIAEFQPLFDEIVAGGTEEETAPASRRMRKSYLALVDGSFGEKRATYREPLGRDRHDARKMRVSSSGKPAVTSVELMGVLGFRGRTCSLLKVELGTGRRHQIRVHLAAHGYPVVGDDLYGTGFEAAPNVSGARGGSGLMLHAWREEFIHPLTGELIRIESAWPQRFPVPATREVRHPW